MEDNQDTHSPASPETNVDSDIDNLLRASSQNIEEIRGDRRGLYLEDEQYSSEIGHSVRELNDAVYYSVSGTIYNSEADNLQYLGNTYQRVSEEQSHSGVHFDLSSVDEMLNEVRQNTNLLTDEAYVQSLLAKIDQLSSKTFDERDELVRLRRQISESVDNNTYNARRLDIDNFTDSCRRIQGRVENANDEITSRERRYENLVEDSASQARRNIVNAIDLKSTSQSGQNPQI